MFLGCARWIEILSALARSEKLIRSQAVAVMIGHAELSLTKTFRATYTAFDSPEAAFAILSWRHRALFPADFLC